MMEEQTNRKTRKQPAADEAGTMYRRIGNTLFKVRVFTNKQIISGEIPLETAIRFIAEKGYDAKTVQVKVSELPKDVSIRAKIARNSQRADEYNYSRQQVGRIDYSRGAR